MCFFPLSIRSHSFHFLGCALSHAVCLCDGKWTSPLFLGHRHAIDDSAITSTSTFSALCSVHTKWNRNNVVVLCSELLFNIDRMQSNWLTNRSARHKLIGYGSMFFSLFGNSFRFVSIIYSEYSIAHWNCLAALSSVSCCHFTIKCLFTQLERIQCVASNSMASFQATNISCCRLLSAIDLTRSGCGLFCLCNQIFDGLFCLNWMTVDRLFDPFELYSV